MFPLSRMRPFPGESSGPESFPRSGSCDWWLLMRNTCRCWEGDVKAMSNREVVCVDRRVSMA